MGRWIILLLIFVQSSFGQNFLGRKIGLAEGLPQSQVFDLLEDHQGNIWVATRGGGVARYDGKSFQKFSTQNGLIQDFVQCIYQASNKDIWIGTSDGVSVYNGIEFKNYAIANIGVPIVVRDILEWDGVVYLATSNGVYKWGSNHFDLVNEALEVPSYFVTALEVDAYNRLWIGHAVGVTMVSNDEKPIQVQGLGKWTIESLKANNKGGVYIGTYGGGLYLIERNTTQKIEGFDGYIINDIFFKADQLWISTQKNGLIILDVEQGSSQIFNPDQKMSTKHIKKVLQDHWGNYWVGTSGGGLYQFKDVPIKNLLPNQLASENYVYALLSSDSLTFAATSSKEIWVFKHGEFIQKIGLDDGLYPLKIKAIQKFQNVFVCGTEGRGLFFYSPNKAWFLDVKKGLAGNFITDLQVYKNQLFVATASGVTVLNEHFEVVESWTKRNKQLPFDRISSLQIDQLGRVWMGSRGAGLFCKSKNGLEVYSSKNGLCHDVIRDLSLDAKGNLFVAAAGGGVGVVKIYLDQIAFSELNQNSGLNSNNIYSVLADFEGDLWVGSEHGVDQIQISDSNIRVVNFGLSDGFTGLETTVGAVSQDAFGGIYWGTIEGLMYKQAGVQTQKEIQPLLAIEGLEIQQTPLTKTAYNNQVEGWFLNSEPVELSYADNSIGFKLTAVDQKFPDGIKYRWRLKNKGEEVPWGVLSNQAAISFSKLPPGVYSFEAQAVNKNGLQSNELAFQFMVLPPFYMQWWFITLVVFLIVVLIWWVIYRRFKKVQAKQAQEIRELASAKELLELEQKALRLQMNPHFIFNALGGVQNKIREGDNKGARYALMQFAKLMRTILDHSRSDVITLEEEIELLSKFMTIEQSVRANRFEFEFLIGENIEPTEIGLPPMLLQPFVENAIIHGFHGIDYLGKIYLRFDLEGEYLVCEILDNGIGRKAAQKNESQQDQTHKSVALEVIQSRLEAFGDQKVKIEISDPEDGGTLIRCVLKVMEAF